jgi:hypothetical protein
MNYPCHVTMVLRHISLFLLNSYKRDYKNTEFFLSPNVWDSFIIYLRLNKIRLILTTALHETRDQFNAPSTDNGIILKNWIIVSTLRTTNGGREC